MQMQMPFFPEATKLINSTLGYFKNNGLVYYLHNGYPIYCHGEHDENFYRFVCASMVENRLCGIRELARALGVNEKNIQRYAESLRKNGAEWFFNREDKRGQCYKLHEEELTEAQEQINHGIAVKQIAKELGVTEGALRHHIRSGKLKKNKL